MGRNKATLLRKFHQARWDEEIICEMSVPGERGILVPRVEREIEAEVGDGVSMIPEGLRREKPAALPEVNQVRVLRHYLRLSQETMGADMTVDASEGTCTMKYSPKVHEQLVGNPGLRDIHPLQDEDTLQGILEVYFRLEKFLKEISGLDHFSFQPGGGAQGVYANACMVRAWHEARKDENRSEIITTLFSHPCDAASPATAGYKVVTLMPDESGYPDLEAMKAALSERTAGIFITNPEDTGIYNPRIDEFVKAAHEVGALCAYDQANANGILGITRAKEAGFDLCHFNIHKTFSSPHACMGHSTGAVGVAGELGRFLPVPRVTYNGTKYRLEYDRPESIGRVRCFFGNASTILRAYAWILQHGADGLREVAECSVLNNNYLLKKLSEIPGVVIQYAEGKRRLEQVRYSWDKLKQDTGVGTEDVMRRMADFGLQHYWMSHPPWIVPEPFTLEPCESYSKDDLDEYVAVLRQISREAYQDPQLVKNAPHNSVVHRVPSPGIDEPERIAVTWRQYQRKKRADSVKPQS